MVTMFNGVNTRIDALNDRMDRTQAETSARFEAVNARFDMMFDRMDRMQAETNARFDHTQAETNARFDRTQAETNARLDAVLEAIMSFDRRVSHLEGRLDAQGAGAAE